MLPLRWQVNQDNTNDPRALVAIGQALGLSQSNFICVVSREIKDDAYIADQWGYMIQYAIRINRDGSDPTPDDKEADIFAVTQVIHSDAPYKKRGKAQVACHRQLAQVLQTIWEEYEQWKTKTPIDTPI